MPNTNSSLALKLQRFQDLAYDKTQGRMWPKIENVLPFSVYAPDKRQILIPLIKNVQNNRHLSRNLPTKFSPPLNPVVKTTPDTLYQTPPVTPKIPEIKPIKLTTAAKSPQEQISIYQQKISELKQENQRLQRETQRLQQAGQAGREGLKVAASQWEKHHGSLLQREARVKELRQNLRKAHVTSQKLKDRLRAKQEELERVRQDSLGQRAQLAVARNEQKASEAMVKNLKAALENLSRAATKPDQVEKLKSRLFQKQKELQDKSQRLNQLELRLGGEAKITQEIQTLRSQIKTLTKNKRGLQNTLNREKEHLSTLKNRVGQLAKQTKEQEQTIKAQEQALEKLANEKLKLAAFIDELVEKLTHAKSNEKLQKIIELELPKTKGGRGEAETEAFVKTIAALPTLDAKTPQITNLPNAINGIVKDQKGNLLQNAVVIIKGKNNQPLRALQTNELGQFAITTPMSNGKYLVEAHKKDLQFDILEVELRGEKLPPIEMRAHGKSI